MQKHFHLIMQAGLTEQTVPVWRLFSSHNTELELILCQGEAQCGQRSCHSQPVSVVDESPLCLRQLLLQQATSVFFTCYCYMAGNHTTGVRDLSVCFLKNAFMAVGD